MKKGLLIYTSQNGSTEKIAQKIGQGLTNKGVSVTLINLAKNQGPIKTGHYDIIGIGSPTYYFRPSYQVLDAIQMLPDMEGKKVFTFVTFGTEIGEGANRIRKTLNKKGCIDMGSYACSGLDLFPGYTKRGAVFSPHGPLKDELSKAENFGENLGTALITDTQPIAAEYDKPTHWVYAFERFVTSRFLTKHLYSRFFSVKKAECTGCKKCISSCPTKNIIKKDDKYPKWENNCTLCCNCEISCPNQAVKTPISWFIFKPFLAYNIYRGKKKGIPWSEGIPQKIKR